jgi:hypothetical protein
LKRSPASVLLCAAAVGGLGLPACVSGFDRNDQIVSSLRILGAAAHIDNGDGIDWADATVSDTVTLSALVANPTGISVVINWVTCLPNSNKTITPCTDAGILQNPLTLVNNPPPGVIQLGVGDTIQYTVPPEVQPLLDQLITNADQNPVAECSVFIEAPILIIAQGIDGSVVTAVKNLRLSPWNKTGPNATDPHLQSYIRNANPTLEALNIANDTSACAGQTLVAGCDAATPCAGGATCSSDGWCPPAPFPAGNSLVCGKVRDSLVDSTTGADVDIQKYYYCGSDGVDGSELEYPTIIWYSTGGSQGSIANKNTAGTPDLASRTFINFGRPAAPFTLYGVVRDGRDGENWIAQDFQ